MRRLVSDQRGGILTIEALALAALWTLLWWILIFQSGSREERAHLHAQTRHCAWRAAVDSCHEPLPADCDTSLRPAAAGGLEEAIGEFLEVVDDLLNFVTGEDVSLERHYAVARREHDNARPAILGGGFDHLRSKHVVPCNPKTRTRTLSDMMDGAYDQLFGW